MTRGFSMHGNAKVFVLMAAMTALVMALGWMLGGQGGAVIALVLAGGMNVFSWWNSDKMVLRQQGAVELSPQQGGDLYALTADLARRADLPMPKLYLLPTEQPNAFATGRNPENSAVAVTQGLVSSLSRDEIAGVIAPFQTVGIAFYGQSYHAEFNFAGRLTAPVETPATAGDLAAWQAEHPAGVIVARLDRDHPDWPPHENIPFRNAPYAIWHAADAPRPESSP